MPRKTIGKIDQRPRRPTFLREWREYRNLTQDQAAEKIGIDRSTLSKIERGGVTYNQPFLEAAADAYSCTPADLISRKPERISELKDVVQATKDCGPILILNEEQVQQLADIMEHLLVMMEMPANRARLAVEQILIAIQARGSQTKDNVARDPPGYSLIETLTSKSRPQDLK
jgi:transcriptional regulator with XRE-family HTH domain